MWVRVKGQIRIPEKGRWAHNNVKLLYSESEPDSELKPKTAATILSSEDSEELLSIFRSCSNIIKIYDGRVRAIL